MAAGVRKFAVFESKPTTGFGCRGTGLYLNTDFPKEQNSRYPASRVPFLTSTSAALGLGVVLNSLLEAARRGGRRKLRLVGGVGFCPTARRITRIPNTDRATSQTLHGTKGGAGLRLQVRNDVQFLVLRRDSCRFGSPFEESDYDVGLLAADLQSMGYTVNIRRSVGGGVGAEGLKNLSHSFLRCMPPGAPTEVFIVDPKFKDQFDILHPTAAYRHVWESIPSLMVIHEDRITPVVELLCEEIAESFKNTETPLPPWRKARSLLSKWQPRQSMDIAVPGPATHAAQSTEIFGRSAPVHIAPTKQHFSERKPGCVGGPEGWS